MCSCIFQFETKIMFYFLWYIFHFKCICTIRSDKIKLICILFPACKIFQFLFRPGEGIHPFCAETWFPFIDKNNVWIPFSLYFYACIMDAILMPQWNVMVMVLMIYATSMIKILRHKLQHRDAFASQLKLGSINESTTCRGSYNFIVDRVKEHLSIIQ